MKTTGTKEQVTIIEDKEINKFQIEFLDLCEKYKIKWVVFWTREQTDTFQNSEKESMCAWFCISEFVCNKNESHSILTAYRSLSSMMSKMALRAMKWKYWPCHCKDCTNEREAKKT